jgi:hypothetical protein
MAQRQNIITFDSTEIQGEGSWIKVRMITHGQRKDYLKNYGDILGKNATDVTPERRDEFQIANDDLVIAMVVDWNWVDDDGIPLPLPKDDPTVIDTLTESEHAFIANSMQGTGERKK